MRTMLRTLAIGLSLLGSLGGGETRAQTLPTLPDDLPVSVALSRPTYLFNNPGDPIAAVVSLENVGAPSIVTAAGFSAEPHHLFLHIRGPQGQLITATELGTAGEGEGPPPLVFPVVPTGGGPLQLVQGEPVEFLPGTGDPDPPGPFVLTRTIADLKTFYALPTPGFYEAQVVIPFRAYDAVQLFTSNGVSIAPIAGTLFQGVLQSVPVRFALVADADGDGFCFPAQDARLCANPQPDCNDGTAAVHPGAPEVPNNGLDDDCNPGTPDVSTGTPGTLAIDAKLHTVGTGSNPGSTKGPLAQLPVRAFDKQNACVAQFGVSWQNFRNIWFGCAAAMPGGIGQTDRAGHTALTVAPGAYLVIGEYDPPTGDPIYIGRSVGGVDAGQTKPVFLQVIAKANGTVVPAKYQTVTGSELWIIEPEYVEWNGTQELYPFVFESIGAWTVTTSVRPPEGFVADQSSLTTEVNTTLTAAQFTITNVGSKWVDTGVTHQLTHKGKKETVKSHVGVKLSDKLATAKGLTRLGKPVKGR